MREFDHAGYILADYQGRIFRDSVEQTDYSSFTFFKLYKNSNFLKRFDMNLDYLETFMTSDAFVSLNDQFNCLEKEKDNKFEKESMYWLGYLYRYISYTREVSTKKIMDVLPPFDLITRHHLYYLEDIEENIKSMLETFKLDESAFHKN